MSLRSLREVTGCLVEMNQEVVRVVLASKHDVWGCADLFALVEDYFDASLHTLDFLAALDRALRRARDSQLVLHLAIQVQDPAVRHARVVDALRRFKADPFMDEFFAAFQAAYRQQLAMLDRLRRQKRRLGRRLRSVRVWRRVTGVVFATIFAAILTDKGTELCPELLLVDGRCSESKLQPFLLTLLITFFAHNRPSSTISGLMRSPKPCRRQWVIDEFVNLAMVGGTYVRFGDLDIGGPMLNSINKCSLLPMII